ncbi:hypothetical protein AB4239_22640, partial [Vibrio sp. 10N.286.45.C10]|uniref:hypothetical protein n=3 Tax=Vibrio TaxID=662 RepID=UPI00354D611A
MNKSSEIFILVTLTLSIFFISLVSLSGNVQRLGVVLFILLSFFILKKNELNVDIRIVAIVIFLMFISITRFIYSYV